MRRGAASRSIRTRTTNSSAGSASPPGGWGALTVFPALARALPASAGQAGVFTATQFADGFEGYVHAYQANSTNFLAFAPGGGVENVGLAHAVNATAFSWVTR